MLSTNIVEVANILRICLFVCFCSLYYYSIVYVINPFLT